MYTRPQCGVREGRRGEGGREKGREGGRREGGREGTCVRGKEKEGKGGFTCGSNTLT